MKSKLEESNDSFNSMCGTIFSPSAAMIRIMARAVLFWGSSDTEPQFLMRFGIIENMEQF